jgi:hypothetical protein
MRHYLLLIAVAAVTVVVVVAGASSSNETYGGSVSDLLLTPSDVPPSFFIAPDMDGGWTFVPDETGAPANNTYQPTEYDTAVFWKTDNNDDPVSNIIEIVGRYSSEQIGEMFSNEGWTFVPNESLEDVQLEDCKGKVRIEESGERTYYFLDVTKKDIVIHLMATVIGDDEVDMDTLLAMAQPILERI